MKFIPNDNQFVPASHEDPSRPGVLKRVLAMKEELLDGRVQMINWARLPVGSSFRLHYHEDMEETFILTRGEAMMTVNGQSIQMHSGDAVIVAPLEQHEMTNSGAEDVEYIVVGISLGKNGKTVVVET